jgi:hypothetical protein
VTCSRATFTSTFTFTHTKYNSHKTVMKIQTKVFSCTYFKQGNGLQIREESSSFAFHSIGTGKEHVEDTCLETLVGTGAFVYTTTHCSLRSYCAILFRRSNFRHQASPRVSPRESTQRRKVELWTRNVR